MNSKCNTLVVNSSKSEQAWFFADIKTAGPAIRQQGQSFGNGFAPSSSEGEKVMQLPPLRAYNYQSNTVRIRKLQKVASCRRYQ